MDDRVEVPSSVPLESPVSPGDAGLERGLSGRQIQMIAIGGALGVGLFLGSGKAIEETGPSLIFCYLVAGAVIFMMMRALGELALYRPVSGSFASYADELLGPRIGFVTGWTYWLTWVVTAMAEITAAGIYVQYWFPEVPQWVTALAVVLLLYAANLISVGVFGEFEFWFALIKVVTIVGIIAIGVAIIVFGFGPLGDSAGVTNLWDHGGMFPKGFAGTLVALQVVMFAFVGVELVGVTAGEARDPERTLPRAVNSIVVRILVFYVGAMVVIMSLVPWTQLDDETSPFVSAFHAVGITGAAGVVNLVVLTAALSSCNSGIFSTGRMMFTLAQRGQAPHRLATVSRRRLPVGAITASAAVLLLGVALNYFVPEDAFEYVTSVATVGALWTWGVIVTAHLAYRRRLRRGAVTASPFRMPGSPVTNWLVLGFLGFVVVLLAFDPQQRVALIAGVVWAVVIVAASVPVLRRTSPQNT
jgi:AAT family amino acid transporter